jgi:streptogramin lyase
MKNKHSPQHHAGRWSGTEYTIKPNALFRRLAVKLIGALLWLAVLPLAAPGQFYYVTPYTFTTLAGKTGVAGSTNGQGTAARFHSPGGVRLDNAGNVYVSDTANDTIRRVTPEGVVTTLAGKAGSYGTNDGTGSNARFNVPYGLVVDTNGNVYVADSGNDTIRKLTPDGTNWNVTTIAGHTLHPGIKDGPGTNALFNGLQDVSIDTNGNLYVADWGNNALREITWDGTNWDVTTISTEFPSAECVSVDTNGNVYVGDGDGTIREATPAEGYWNVTTLAGQSGIIASRDGTNQYALFSNPTGIAVDNNGDVYVSDGGNNTIRILRPEGANWVTTTLAGPGAGTNIDGTGKSAEFNFPDDLAVDSAANVYVADYNNDTIRKGYLAPVPAPILISLLLSNDQFAFGITGLSNLAVKIESSTNLSQWQVVGGTSILTGGSNSFTNLNPSLGAQFYRIHVN